MKPMSKLAAFWGLDRALYKVIYYLPALSTIPPSVQFPLFIFVGLTVLYYMCRCCLDCCCCCCYSSEEEEEMKDRFRRERALLREAQMKHNDLHSHPPHSVSTGVAWQGSARALVRYLIHGLKCGMQDLGIKSIEQLHAALDKGELRLECRSAFASRLWEAHAPVIRCAPQPELMPLFVSLRGRVA